MGVFMNSGEFTYILRFAVQPGHHENNRLEGLADFCLKARIDDVMFFIDCEELSQGHLTVPETRLWLNVIERGKALLEPLGITTSINPWPTLLHGDRGRALKKGQNFNLMVDPYGNKAGAVACPLCDEWRNYITEIYACYASLKPNMLWVEDDFRLHNHGPLVWGGCFCDTHMEEYSKRAGKKLSREEFVEGILKPGKPHPYRKIWLDTSRDIMVEDAELIGKAVHTVSPETKVGLMSSGPSVHCAEGRDWKGILDGFAGSTTAVNRPHLPAYNECTPQNYLRDFSSVSTHTCAMIPKYTEIYPELESFPHTRFSKSKTLTRFQLDTSLILGADGITLNIFDMMGNGIMLKEGYQDVLAMSKNFLNCVKQLGLKGGSREGVKILTSPRSSYTIQTETGKSMEDLYPQETFWSSLLSCFGIANTFSLETDHKDEVLAVSGQYLRNLSKLEIKNLFENNFVLLDGEAAYTLFDLGFGELAGIRSAEWHKMDSGFQAFEQVSDKKIYCGIEEARISAQAVTGDFVKFDYSGNIVLKTMVKNPFSDTVAAGMAEFEGRVLILPYGHFKDSYQSHLNPVRQEIIQDALVKAKIGRCPTFIKGEPYVAVHQYGFGDKKVAIICNWSNDKLDEVEIYIPFYTGKDIREMDRENIVTVKADVRFDGNWMVMNKGLGVMELKILIFD
jgi:hypothetical protein